MFAMATVSGGQPPGTGPPENQTLTSVTQEVSGLKSPTISAKIQGPGLKSMADVVKNSSGGLSNMQSFAQILEQEKKNDAKAG